MINFLKGDATEPVSKPALIVHVCNNVGGWGAGFVVAISKKWKKPEMIYRNLFQREENIQLGEIQFVMVESDIHVCNMIAQDGLFKKGDAIGKVYINYDALKSTLSKAATYATEKELSIHMPRIGCGLAGGKWDIVGDIVSKELKNLDVYVYDYN